MKQFYTLYMKEFGSYFKSSLAYFIFGIYALISMLVTFYTGHYFELSNSELFSFFYFQPDILVMVVPALTMKLWAEERKSGSIELLLTQPLSYFLVVITKFLASLSMGCLLLILSFPLWLYTSRYVFVDNLNIFANYLGCFFLISAFCAIGCLISSFNKNPISAYIISVFVLWGIRVVDFSFLAHIFSSDEILLKSAQSINFEHHYQNIISGQLFIDNLAYFIILTVFALWLNVYSAEYKRD